MLPPDVLRVAYRLYRNGHQAFLVGGAVRDLLLGRKPKDFDMGTDASPARVKRLFRNARIIGRRFKIVHLWFRSGDVIELTTFRRQAVDNQKTTIVNEDGMLARDNTFGTPAEDALRRDLTVNGLFYDIAANVVIDHVGGLDDLENSIIRTIGEPSRRFTEDPVRILRAIRHAARIGFTIDDQTYQAIVAQRQSLRQCSDSRLGEELLKDLKGGAAAETFAMWHSSEVLQVLSPEFSSCLATQTNADRSLLELTLELLKRAEAAKSTNNTQVDPVMAAALFFPVTYHEAFGDSPDADAHLPSLWEDTVHGKVKALAKSIKIPRRLNEALCRLLGNMWRAFSSSSRPIHRIAGKHFAADFSRLLTLVHSLDAWPISQTDLGTITKARHRRPRRKPRK